MDRGKYEEIAAFLRARVTLRPRVGVVCGSGLGGLAAAVQSEVRVPYSEVPHFPSTTVAGHAGELVFGTIGATPVVLMCGRFHMYEGHPAETVTIGVRAMQLLGVEILILTSAVGGLNPSFKVTDIVALSDHIFLPGLVGGSALVGPNDDTLGPRFPSMAHAYDEPLRAVLLRVADSLGMSPFVHEGVLACLSGPMYETPATCRWLRSAGADVVGMSTCPEAVVARHAGMRVVALQLVTDVVFRADGSLEAPPNHEIVLKAAARRADDVQRLVTEFVKVLATDSGALALVERFKVKRAAASRRLVWFTGVGVAAAATMALMRVWRASR